MEAAGRQANPSRQRFETCSIGLLKEQFDLEEQVLVSINVGLVFASTKSYLFVEVFIQTRRW